MLQFYFIFFKQKTAYEMRSSDGSSDVCSSDLIVQGGYRIGTLAVFDSVPRRFDTLARGQLKEIATLVTDALELHRALAETEAAREEAIIASRSEGEFLAFLSHELRTPLHALIGFSEQLQRESQIESAAVWEQVSAKVTILVVANSY